MFPPSFLFSCFFCPCWKARVSPSSLTLRTPHLHKQKNNINENHKKDAHKTGVAQEAAQAAQQAGGAGAKAAGRAGDMALEEARKILGVAPGAAWQEVHARCARLYARNDKDGSFYLVSKVYRAGEALEQAYQAEGLRPPGSPSVAQVWQQQQQGQEGQQAGGEGGKEGGARQQLGGGGGGGNGGGSGGGSGGEGGR